MLPLNVDTKKCTSCKCKKPISEFHKCKKHKDGLFSKCKKCWSDYRKQPKIREREQIRSQLSRQRDPERHRAYTRKSMQKWRAEFKDTDPEGYRDYKREQFKKWLQKSPQAALRYKIRLITNSVIRDNLSTGYYVGVLGLTSRDFCAHIEAQFELGMTWENKGEWELDHIKPLCTFDLTLASEFKKAAHYSNVRPLWKTENIRRNRDLHLFKA